VCWLYHPYKLINYGGTRSLKGLKPQVQPCRVQRWPQHEAIFYLF